jgi:hypothetical protein
MVKSRYTGKWTETVAISHNGPSDPDYFRLARYPPTISRHYATQSLLIWRFTSALASQGVSLG